MSAPIVERATTTHADGIGRGRSGGPASTGAGDGAGDRAGGTLRIELEEAAARKLWVSTLGLLSGMVQQWHFVGLIGDQVRYESPTFSAPCSWGNLPLGRTMLPREEWVPGMDTALEALHREITADGWVRVDGGEQAWECRFRRPDESSDPASTPSPG